MSLEKCFTVYFPLKSKTVCTIRTAKWATGVAGIVLAGYDSVYFVGMESFITLSGRHFCLFNGVYLYVTLQAINSVLYSFGPFTIMSITNFAIVFKFLRAKCNKNNSSESTNPALAKSATRGTSMVVTVSVTFLLLTSPSALSIPQTNGDRLSNIPLYRAFMNLTQYLNHSINCLLYIIFGSKFRNEFLKIFSCKERPEGLSSSQPLKNTSRNNISGSRN